MVTDVINSLDRKASLLILVIPEDITTSPVQDEPLVKVVPLTV
jgi:hypothetical protein